MFHVMRPWLLALLVLLIAAPLAAVVLTLRGGLSARPEPSRLEVSVARLARRLAMPGAAKGQRNPAPASAETVAEGRDHFADHCALCHANNGSGETALGGSMLPRAPDMRQAATQSLTDGELLFVIQEGVRFTGMPAWALAESDEHDLDEDWRLVDFIRHLPDLTADEEKQMRRKNPRPVDED
jgi:mono/diheme cytochrome c family protein